MKEELRIQGDDTDIAPLINPESPQKPEPRDLEDPACSPGTMTSDPDSLTDQSDSGMMEDKSETGDGSKSADEYDSEVEELLPLVNKA